MQTTHTSEQSSAATRSGATPKAVASNQVLVLPEKAKANTFSRPVPPLLLKTKEVCAMLGGIHPRTLARLEKAGQLRSTHFLRHKCYARADIELFVEGLRSWKA